ncbi:MAG: response regulator transcription factor [Desulfobulbaceae bacterium]|jgi:two-component system alkaline phosphatase synthesis response regulator PhoP|nr:response regulator transcription factor [Desulfobulbaceae bacterium]
MQTCHIYAVEDDDNIREMLLYALSSSGFQARGFTDGGTLFPAVAELLPDLILLDIMLPGDDGITILKKMKKSGKTAQIPVIMLTAKGAEHDRVRGLDLGADDYITKPFSVMEVLARVRAVLRRTASMESASELRVGSLSLHREKRQVLADGAEIVLTYKEFELLAALMRGAGIVLSRDQLLERVWGYDREVESRTVDMHIRTLRRKLGGHGGLIKTVRNVGYKIEE